MRGIIPEIATSRSTQDGESYFNLRYNDQKEMAEPCNTHMNNQGRF